MGNSALLRIADATGRWRAGIVFALLLFCVLAPISAHAQSSPSLRLSPFGVDIHAFVGQGFLLTTDNNYLAKSQHGSAEFTEIGLNVSKNVTDELRIGMQLFARDLGPRGDYRPQFDWAYLDYRLWNWLGIRAGRTKIPFGLYNEINDVDMARVPVLLPQAMYPIENRDALLSITGGELYGFVPLSILGELEYRLYGGTIFMETPRSNNPDVTVTDLHVPYVAGGRLMWLTPLEGLQMGGGLQVLRFDTEFTLSPTLRDGLVTAGAVPQDFDGRVPTRIPLRLWITSIEYAAHDLLLAAEYGRWHGEVQSDFVAVIPNSNNVNERFYGMASYQVSPWFAPGAYYSMFYFDAPDRKGRDAYQHDWAATLRFDITQNWLLKLEGHLMRGTRGLQDSQNRKPLDQLAPTWGLFLIKTTAYF